MSESGLSCKGSCVSVGAGADILSLDNVFFEEKTCVWELLLTMVDLL